MGAAPLLLAMAIVTADVGWESDGRGGYQYIVQVPIEQWESIKREGEITSQIPENLRGKVSSIKIRVGEGPMPRPNVVAASGITRKLPGPPDTVPTVRAQSGDGFQMPDLQNLPEAGKEIVDNARQQFGSQLNEMANQAGQQVNGAVNEAVNNAATNMREAATETFNNTLNNFTNTNRNAGTTPTQPPALQPTTSPTTAPTTQPFAQPNTRSNTPPTTSAAGSGNNSFPTGDSRGFSNRSPQMQTSGQPQAGQSQAGQPPFGQPQAGQGTSSTNTNLTNNPAAINPALNPTTQPRVNPAATQPSGPSTSSSNSLTTSTPWSPDPPSITAQNNSQLTIDPLQTNLTIQQRFQQVSSQFHFDEYGDLIVDEAVLYVVGVSGEVGIDATGRLYDKKTNKWLRNNDPRYIDVINFIDQYNAVRKERLASANNNAGILQSPPSSNVTTPTFPTGRPANLFEGNLNPAMGNFAGGFANGYPAGYTIPANNAATNPYTQTQAPTNTNLGSQSSGSSSAVDIEEKVELALLRRELAQRESEKNAKASQTSLAQQSVAQTNTNTSGSSTSASDSESRRKQQSVDEVQSQPVFNFLLLLSILANAYLGIAISRLLKRYRNLVASHRGNTLGSV